MLDKGRQMPHHRAQVIHSGGNELIALEADKERVGTMRYQGVAWFWNYEFRHYLRDADRWARVRVHNAFLRAGLAVDGDSEAHWQIVREVPTW